MTPRQSKATTPANQRLVELVRAAFKASGMTRAELAERSGVPEGTISNLLAPRADRPVYAEQMLGLADALGASITDWFREMREAREGPEEPGRVEP